MDSIITPEGVIHVDSDTGLEIEDCASFDNGNTYVDAADLTAEQIALVLHYADDEIREDLHGEGYDSEIAFVTAYLDRHAKKFGAPLVIG